MTSLRICTVSESIRYHDANQKSITRILYETEIPKLSQRTFEITYTLPSDRSYAMDTLILCSPFAVPFSQKLESFEIFNDRASCQGGVLCTRIMVILHCLRETFPMEPGRYTRHRSSTYTPTGLLHYIQDLLSPLCQRSKWPRKSRRALRNRLRLYFSRVAPFLSGDAQEKEEM